MIKTPFISQRPQPKRNDSISMAFGLQAIHDAVEELQNLHAEHQAEHEVNQERMKREHEAKLAELDKAMSQVHHLATVVHKGEPGKDAPPVDVSAIVNHIQSNIRVPKDGISPVVDEVKIAKLAALYVPKPKDGKDAMDIDHEVIAEKAVELLKKKKLKLEHIGDFKDGLEQTMRPIRSLMAGFRGGGDTVSAGSNITITNVGGSKVISSTGGSGFTQLTATETPNGSRTAFTFAAASAQPTYLVVDNVWMKAIAKSGTVNWTWLGTVATLTIPPNDDIWGVQ